MKTVSLVLLSLLLLGGCNTVDRVKDGLWRYPTGYYVGDTIHFKNENAWTIDENGRLFKAGTHVATVKRIDMLRNELEILSHTNESGYYQKIN